MNTEQIVLTFPNNTRDAYVIKQIIERLDGLVISFEHKTIFGFDKPMEETA